MDRNILIILLILTFSSCSDNQNVNKVSFGVKYNTFRLKHDIPVIDSSWVLEYDRINNKIFAINPIKRKLNNPICLMKRIYFDKQGSYVQEDTEYYGRDTFFFDDKYMHEYLTHSYDAKTDSISYTLFCKEEFPSKVLDRNEADSIILNWGLNDYWTVK